jgi:hypothetical protein
MKKRFFVACLILFVLLSPVIKVLGYEMVCASYEGKIYQLDSLVSSNLQSSIFRN